jgi:hypothetical protein
VVVFDIGLSRKRIEKRRCKKGKRGRKGEWQRKKTVMNKERYRWKKGKGE